MSLPLDQATRTDRRAARLILTGRVQGIGMRPAIARLAAACHLAGHVRNTNAGLEIVVEGEPRELRRFRRELPAAVPPGGELRKIAESKARPANRREFVIDRDDARSAPATPVPRDAVACDECLAEVASPSDRRSDYALASCASCGPRYSMITRMPYERDQTAMAGFPMCAACAGEYEHPRDRRFHAESIACPTCGPKVWAVDASRRALGSGAEAVRAAVAVLRAGGIVSLKGVGGYQLLCDAANAGSIERLRTRKGRRAKPFALLVASLDEAECWSMLDDAERAALTSTVGPIVLVRARRGMLRESIAPGLNTVGLMLPTTPLHHLLAREFGGPLVCTSANREGEPLEYENEQAERNLAGIADAWLHHDRPIVHPIDDSVVRVIAGTAVTIRLARGLAPLPLALSAGEPTLALGGHLKGAAAWCNGAQAVLGPHVGDLDALAGRERFIAQCAAWRALYSFQPRRLACDLHPDYFTSQWGARQGMPVVSIQHHFAHVAAGMLEHRLLDRWTLGLAWDGTGYGTDGGVWGGEALAVDRTRAFCRVAHLRPFVLPGGEAAIREPWRVAVAVLDQAVGRDVLLRARWPDVDVRRMEGVIGLLDRPGLSPQSTSMGRLFDAAAAIILNVAEARYEGEAAMLLEGAADEERDVREAYPLALDGDDPPQWDWRGLFAGLWNDRQAGVSPARMAMRFHGAMARGALLIAERFPDSPVVLSGGVFQNRLLTELIAERFNGTERLYAPGVIPPNDGGLAAGQLAIALACAEHRAKSAARHSRKK